MVNKSSNKESNTCSRCPTIFKKYSVKMIINNGTDKEVVCSNCCNEHYSKNE